MGAEHSTAASGGGLGKPKAQHADLEPRAKEANDLPGVGEASPSPSAASSAAEQAARSEAQQRALKNIADLLGGDDEAGDGAERAPPPSVSSTFSPPPLTPQDSPSRSPEPPAEPLPVPVRASLARTGLGESHLELWQQIIEWVGEVSPAIAAAASSAATAESPAAASSSSSFGPILAWDSEEVADRVLSLPTDERLKRTLADRHARRRAARAEQARAAKARERVGGVPGHDASAAAAAASPVELERLSTPASAASSTSSSFAFPSPMAAGGSGGGVLAPLPPTVPIPFPLAQQLLSLDSSLAALRLASVPSRVSEDTFWDCYFAALLASLREHVNALQHQREQHR